MANVEDGEFQRATDWEMPLRRSALQIGFAGGVHGQMLLSGLQQRKRDRAYHHRGGPDAGFEVTGALSEYAKMSDSGHRLTKYFCTTCGSTIFTRPEKLQGLVVMRAGTLDDRSVIEPQLQMYVSRAPAWDRPDDKITSFPGMATAW